MNKYKTKTNSDAQELDYFTATFLEQCLAQYQPEVLVLLNKVLVRELTWARNYFQKASFGG